MARAPRHKPRVKVWQEGSGPADENSETAKGLAKAPSEGANQGPSIAITRDPNLAFDSLEKHLNELEALILDLYNEAEILYKDASSNNPAGRAAPDYPLPHRPQCLADNSTVFIPNPDEESGGSLAVVYSSLAEQWDDWETIRQDIISSAD